MHACMYVCMSVSLLAIFNRLSRQLRGCNSNNKLYSFSRKLWHNNNNNKQSETNEMCLHMFDLRL